MKHVRTTLCLLAVLALIMTALTAPAFAADFIPALDTNAGARIRVVGTYYNFESLEAEFDAFNRYYPNVELSYTRLDDYKNIIGTALTGDKPNIFFSYPWMVGKEHYTAVFESMEDLSDPALDIDLGCIRSELLYKDAEGRVPMAPVFSTTYGMLVNEALFEKLGLEIPTSYSGLLSACEAFRAAGCDTPVLGYYDTGSSMLYSLVYPYACGLLKDRPEAVEAVNSFAPGAGEYFRPVLELTKNFMDSGCVNKEVCASLADNYNAMILRFFEGDIPMMFCNGDTVSGTGKREARSEAFQANPFPYSFWPIPVTEEGGWFVTLVPMSFSVNVNCDDLDMTNEFMRFLLSTKELNELARIKRLLTASADLSLDGVYAAFGEVDEAHSLYAESLGLLDEPCRELRRAVYAVAEGTMSVDEAVESFGKLEG